MNFGISLLIDVHFSNDCNQLSIRALIALRSEHRPQPIVSRETLLPVAFTRCVNPSRHLLVSRFVDEAFPCYEVERCIVRGSQDLCNVSIRATKR